MPHWSVPSSWFEGVSSARQRDPRVFLSLLVCWPLSEATLQNNFQETTDDRKETTSSFPTSDDVYHSGFFFVFHNDPRVSD